MALTATERSIRDREKRSRAAWDRRRRQEEVAAEEALEARAEAEDVEEIEPAPEKAKKS